MNYKQQIEQKAREYALIPIDVNIDTYGTENQIEAYNDFLAGAEAMREIVNTWIPISQPPPAGIPINVKRWLGRIEAMTFNQDEIDGGIPERLNITHWKPITL